MQIRAMMLGERGLPRRDVDLHHDETFRLWVNGEPVKSVTRNGDAIILHVVGRTSMLSIPADHYHEVVGLRPVKLD